MWFQKPKKKATIKNSLDPFTGVFELISDPVWESRYNSSDMTLEFLIRYGDRLAAPYITYFKQPGQEDIPLTEEQVRKIMNMINNKYRESWKRKYAVLDATYGIVDNYMMMEREEIDRDTLDTRINDILRTTKDSKTQLVEMLDEIKRNEATRNEKSGSDTTTEQNSLKSKSQSRDQRDSSRIYKDSDELEFINRVDSETRDLSKSSSASEDNNVSETDELTFIDRSDTTTTESQQTTAETETGLTQETETGINDEDSDRFTYGYTGVTGSATGTPTERSEGMRTTQADKDTDSTISRDGTNTGNGTESLTKDGTEISTRTKNDSSNTTNSETDEGTVSNSKTGSELNTKSGSENQGESGSANTSNDETGQGQQVVKYGNQESQTSTADNTTSGKTDTTENVTSDEESNETESATGNVKEVRTMERSGNIGVTTATQLLSEHVKFWSYNFMDEVYKDIANELTLSVYEQEEDINGDIWW